mgnify:CR=1 FL=1
MAKKKKAMSEKEMFLKAYERGNPQFWLNRTRPKKKKDKPLDKLKRITKENKQKFSSFSWKNWLHP